ETAMRQREIASGTDRMRNDDDREQNQGLVKRNPQRKPPRRAADDAPRSRCFVLQSPFCANCDHQEQNQKRLMVRPSEFRSMNENWTYRVEQQQRSAISQPAPPRPPPEEPSRHQPDERRNNRTRQIERADSERLQCR